MKIGPIDRSKNKNRIRNLYIWMDVFSSVQFLRYEIGQIKRYSYTLWTNQDEIWKILRIKMMPNGVKRVFYFEPIQRCNLYLAVPYGIFIMNLYCYQLPLAFSFQLITCKWYALEYVAHIRSRIEMRTIAFNSNYSTELKLILSARINYFDPFWSRCTHCRLFESQIA